MKKLVVVFIVVFALQSCTELAFTEAMPPGELDLTEFPENFRGTFKSTLETGDTLIITSTDVSGQRFHISDKNVLRKCGNYIVCNEKKPDRWILGLIRSNGHRGFTVYRFDVENGKSKEAIADITTISEVPDSTGGIDYLLVSPTEKEFRKMVRSRAFIRAEKFERID